jgi:membrane-associated phospholipid phosphatase
MSRALVLAALALAGAAVAQPPPAVEPSPAPHAVVTRWNEAALQAVRASRTPPPVAARNLAALHVAVYDAVAATDAAYRPFRVRFTPAVDADPDVAAAVAAHRTLAELYPDRVGEFDAVLDDTIGHVPDGPRKDAGVTAGQTVAERVLRWRAADTSVSRVSAYTPQGGTGRWRFTPPDYRPPLLPGWAAVSCFALPGLADFRPPGPPAVGSAEYAVAYREVVGLGAADSLARTPDQTAVAKFWADGDGTVTPPGHWNRIAQTVAADRRLGTAEAARLFALLNVAMADAAVVCWDCKFRFDVWRPVTAARETDPGWTPLLTTPPFPAYTSGHSSFSGAAAAALAAFCGTDRVRFTSTSEGLPGATRAYTGFWQAAEEAGMSRIYGGIHWQFDNRDGLACGRRVAVYVADHFFRPPGPGAGGRADAPAAFGVLGRGR